MFKYFFVLFVSFPAQKFTSVSFRNPKRRSSKLLKQVIIQTGESQRWAKSSTSQSLIVLVLQELIIQIQHLRSCGLWMKVIKNMCSLSTGLFFKMTEISQTPVCFLTPSLAATRPPDTSRYNLSHPTIFCFLPFLTLRGHNPIKRAIVLTQKTTL